MAASRQTPPQQPDWNVQGTGLNRWASIVPWKKFFVKTTSVNVEKWFKNPKNLKFSKTSKRFQLLPNASEWVPMGPNGSGSFEKLAKTSKNLRKLWKTSQKLRKTSRKILQKLFSRRSMFMSLCGIQLCEIHFTRSKVRAFHCEVECN